MYKQKVKRSFQGMQLKKIQIVPVTPLYEKYNLKRTTVIKDANDAEHEFDYDEITDRQLIGEGAFGVVFKIHHAKSKLNLAVKRVDGKKLDESNNFNKEIMDIFVPIKVGDYEYLVKFYGALYSEGDYWIISELMDTSIDFFNNAAKAKKVEISELVFSKLSHAVLSALIYLKTKGYMHRDIKPSNVLINRNGEIKVCDFGISGKINESICMTVGKGCRPYMSPEKIDEQLSQNGYTVKADIWSLGITLIEIANGEHPYQTLDYVQQIITIAKDEPPKLNSLKYSSMFGSFVDLCLKKLEVERGSCNDLIEHDFIKRYENESNDLVLINEVIDYLTKNDHLRSHDESFSD
jgi:serine/threonine protein kinase